MESIRKKEKGKGKKTWDRVKNSSSLLKYKKMKKQEKKTIFNKWTLRDQYFNFKRELRAEIKRMFRWDMIIQVRKMKRER